MDKETGHKFIVLEGISGSGKTELGKLLAQQTSSQYYATPPEAFRSSRKLVDEGVTLEARFWFYLASIVQASREIEALLRTGRVVCDKYILSTICYHRALGLDVALPQEIRYFEPDHTFLIYCDDKVRLGRLRASRGPITDRRKYDCRQEMERRCLAELRTHHLQEINNTLDGPQHAVDQILANIRK